MNLNSRFLNVGRRPLVIITNIIICSLILWLVFTVDGQFILHPSISRIGISVYIMTFGRKELVEEAIQSYIMQNPDPKYTELVINNDEERVHFYIDEKIKQKYNIKILNKENYNDHGKGFKHKYMDTLEALQFDYFMRIDDDDIMMNDAIKLSRFYIDRNPGFDMYRCDRAHHTYMMDHWDDEVQKMVNCLLIMTRDFYNRLDWPNFEEPPGEDQWIVYKQYGTLKEYFDVTYMYRRPGNAGKNLSYVSIGEVQKQRHQLYTGDIRLNPHFDDDWWSYAFINEYMPEQIARRKDDGKFTRRSELIRKKYIDIMNTMHPIDKFLLSIVGLIVLYHTITFLFNELIVSTFKITAYKVIYSLRSTEVNDNDLNDLIRTV